MILTFEKQQELKPIAASFRPKYKQLATEVERVELPQLIGDVELDLSDDDLLDGCTFEYKEKTTQHFGLRTVLAYLNYAKYVSESYIHDTFSGLVAKRSEYSERISSGDIKRVQAENRQVAFFYFENVRRYIEVKYGDVQQNTNYHKPKITNIKL